MDASARSAAKQVARLARKSPWRPGSVDNLGGFAIIDPFRKNILRGEKFDLTAKDVIGICTPDREN